MLTLYGKLLQQSIGITELHTYLPAAGSFLVACRPQTSSVKIGTSNSVDTLEHF